MLRSTARLTLTLGLLACVVASWSCSGDGEIRERRRLAQEQLAASSTFQDLTAPAEAQPEEQPATSSGEGESLDEMSAAIEEESAGKPEAEPVRATFRDNARVGNEMEALDATREELSLRHQEARFHAKRGDTLFEQNRFAEAEESYRRALDLDASLAAARERYHLAQVYLDKRQGEPPTIIHELELEKRVIQKQKRIEIRRDLDQGREALDAGELERAEQLVGRAQDRILFDPDTDAEIASEARDLMDGIRSRLAGRESQQKTRALEEARNRAESELQLEDERSRRQVQGILRKAAGFVRLQEYEKAVDACQRILELDKDNRVAKFWLRDATEQLINQRRLKLISGRIENSELMVESYLEASIPYDEFFVFPDDEYWHEVRKREGETSLGGLEESEAVRRIKDSLERTPVSFGFDNDPLDVALDHLKQLVGINIAVDPEVDSESVEVTLQVNNLPAINALNLLLENAGLAYTYRSNVLYVTTLEGTGGQTEFVIYPVSDLLNRIRDFQGPELILRGPNESQGEASVGFTSDNVEEVDSLSDDQLIELIQASSGTDDWESEFNNMEYHNGQLLVDAPPELHEKIRTVLENLRQDSDLFVVIEARFLDIVDDFLEDVGVDSRALGLVNNWGTPYGNQINDDRTGGQDLGFVKQGSPVRDVTLVMGQDRWAGRVQHIIDGFTGTVRGDRLSAGNGASGLTMQSTWLEPFQINTILRAVQETSDVRQLTAPVITAHNGQRVYVSIITQRAYIADYELVSGGTGFAIIEVADPVVQTFQEGVILDVDPVVHHDKKYVTLDVRPTLATLIGGIISTIQISLGSATNVAFQVPIGVPEISLQQAFTSVTVPNGGTVLLGGFKSMNESKFTAYLPLLGKIPILRNIFRRKAQVIEKRSLVILLTARIVDLRGAEDKKFNVE